jgi:hypothetical protein
VEADERIDQGEADRSPVGIALGVARWQRVVRDDALDVLHHVEGRPVHGGVLAQDVWSRRGEVRPRESREYAVLAGHVVRGR